MRLRKPRAEPRRCFLGEEAGTDVQGPTCLAADSLKSKLVEAAERGEAGSAATAMDGLFKKEGAC